MATKLCSGRRSRERMHMKEVRKKSTESPAARERHERMASVKPVSHFVRERRYRDNATGLQITV